jgi:hypothetical protein
MGGKDSSCRMFYQDGKEYAGPDRRKSERFDLSEEGKAIVTEISQRIKNHHLDNCIIPKESRPHLKHATLAIEEIGEGSIPYGINKSKDVIKRSYDQFESQDKSKRTALNSAIKYIIAGLFTLLVAGVTYVIVKGG